LIRSILYCSNVLVLMNTVFNLKNLQRV
jgi:hypothetical protein